MATQYGWMTFQDVISDAATKLKDPAMNEFVPALLRSWASQANRDFARRSETPRKEIKMVLVAGKAEYDYPPGVRKLKRVRIKYPGYTGYVEMTPIDHDLLLDGIAASVTGRPDYVYIKEDRTGFGLWRTPTVGGLDSAATSDGNVGGTTIVCSDGSSTDDKYNTYTIRLTSGSDAGVERTISDYTGSTGTIEVSVAFPATVPKVVTGISFEILPDSMILDAIMAGNSYGIGPVASVVSEGVGGTVARRDRFAINDSAKPPGYWDGCEVRFTDTDVITRVISSSYDGLGKSLLTVSPELPTVPSDPNPVVLTEVPNIPPDFHHYLSHFIVAEAKRSRGQDGGEDRAIFEAGIVEARKAFDRKHKIVSGQVRTEDEDYLTGSW